MKVNALKIRQSFGLVIRTLQKNKEPIIIEKNRTPVAVLISIEMYKDRFIDYLDQQKKIELLEFTKSAGKTSKKSSLNILRELRYGSDN